MDQSKYYQIKLSVVVLLLSGLMSLPALFDSYRKNAFDTIPRDPYEAYLLHLDGDTSGFLPGSPFTYRVFSILPGYLIYNILPQAPDLELLKNDHPHWHKALFAISLSNYLAITLLAWLVFRLMYIQLSAGIGYSLLSSFSVMAFMRYTADYMVDPVVILYLFSLFYFYRNFVLWALLLIIGVGVNEKIPLIFALYTMATLVHTRSRSNYLRFGLSVFACLIYLYVRVIAFPMEGYENQVDPGSYWAGFLNTLCLTISLKGLYLILLPIGIMLLFCWPLFKGAKDINSALPYPLMPSHIGVIVAIALVAYLTNVEYNVGRNVMHLFPIYLPPFILYLKHRLPETGS